MCDLYKALRLTEGRFTTEEDLPKQDLGHIQYTYDDLSVDHINDFEVS